MLQPFMTCFGVSGNTSVFGGIGEYNNVVGFSNKLYTKTIMPTDGKISNLHLYYDDDIQIGNTMYLTVMKNDQPTSLVAQFDGGYSSLSLNSRTAFNLNDEVLVSAGDMINLKVTCSGDVFSNSFIHASLVWSSSNSMLNARWTVGPSGSGNTYQFGKVPFDCYVQNFYIRTQSNQSNTYDLVKNSSIVSSAPTITLANNSYGISTNTTLFSNTLSLSSGDFLGIRFGSGGSVSPFNTIYSMEIVPKVPGQCMWTVVFTNSGLSTNTSNMFYASHTDLQFTAEQSIPDLDTISNPIPYMIPPCDFKIKSMNFSSLGSAGVGSNVLRRPAIYTYTNNGAGLGLSKISYLNYNNSNLQVSLSGTNTSNSDTINSFSLKRDHRFTITTSGDTAGIRRVYGLGSAYASFIIYDSVVERPMIFHDRFTAQNI